MTHTICQVIKKTLVQRGLAIIFVIGLMATMNGCGNGKSDEEIIGELGQKFMLALYTSNKDMAKEICNKTGYETFEQLSSMVKLATMGMNEQADEALIISKLDVVDVKMVSEKKGVANILSYLDDEPKEYSIPAEKDENGNWKVCVTKQSFN